MINEIWHGDCLELMENIPDKSIDMVFCDLPFGMTQNEWDKAIDFKSLWMQYERIIKPNGAIVLFAAGIFTAKLMLSNEKLYRYNWVYEKTTASNPLNANRMPMRVHEDVCVFYKKLPTYNAQKTHGHERKVSTVKHRENCIKSNNSGDYEPNAYDSTERFPRSVLKFSTDKQKSTLNETQKPVALLEYFIKTYSNEDDLILDNCAGSGSMAEAAINTNRRYLLIEKRLDQVQKATNRINDILYKDLL